MSEQKTLHFGEREHADDLIATLGQEVMRSVSEAFLDEVLPLDAMEKRRVGATIDELVPTRAVLVREAAHTDGDHRGPAHAFHGRYRIHATPKTTRSIRSQRKSRSSNCNRLAVRSRFT